MHFVTGGAFNGKRKWVKQYYSGDVTWLSAYELDELGAPTGELTGTVILEGIEHWVRKEIDPELSADILLDKAIEKLEHWIEWEQKEANHKLVLIGTDISKGIVPIGKTDRLQRDVVGWIYQELVQRAERVDIIWYGMAQTIKNSK